MYWLTHFSSLEGSIWKLALKQGLGRMLFALEDSEPVLQASFFCGPRCSALHVWEFNTFLSSNCLMIYWLNKQHCISEVIAFSTQVIWCLHAPDMSSKQLGNPMLCHSRAGKLRRRICKSEIAEIQVNWRNLQNKLANKNRIFFKKNWDSCFLSSPEGEKRRLAIFQSAKFTGLLRRWSIYWKRDFTENDGFGSSFQDSNQLPHRTWDPRIIIFASTNTGLPGGSGVNNLPAMQEMWEIVTGSGRSPGRGNGNPLQYSSRDNPMDRGAWRATVHRDTKNRTQLSKWEHHSKATSSKSILSGMCVCASGWTVTYIFSF